MDDNRSKWRLREIVKVAGEPQGKERPRFNRRTGRVFTPKNTLAYEGKIKWLTAALLIEGPVQVEIWAIFKRPKRLMRRADPEGLAFYEGRVDLDNVIKAVNDGLQGRAFKNDRQVTDIHSFARYAEKATPKQARTEILIYELKPITSETDDEDMAPRTSGSDTCSSS